MSSEPDPTKAVTGEVQVRLLAPGCPVADLTVAIAVDERSGDDW